MCKGERDASSNRKEREKVWKQKTRDGGAEGTNKNNLRTESKEEKQRESSRRTHARTHISSGGKRGSHICGRCAWRLHVH